MKLNKNGDRRGIYVRTPAIREAIRQARLGTHNSEESKRKQSASMKKTACDPAWRKRVSDGTRKKMHTASVRRKHLAGLRKARKAHGVNFTTFGRDLVRFEREMAKVLCPLGYVQQHYVRTNWPGFYLDFALVENKIAIECDGPKHRSFAEQEYDRKRDKLLNKLGWKVIRVQHD